MVDVKTHTRTHTHTHTPWFSVSRSFGVSVSSICKEVKPEHTSCQTDPLSTQTEEFVRGMGHIQVL